MSDKLVTLDKLQAGDSGRVIMLESDGALRRRLQDIGIINGTIIKCVGKSPFGDPKAYMVRGAVIALRNIDSKKIKVEKLNSPLRV